MAFVPQGQQLFGTMTVDENLHVVADRYGSEAKTRYDEAVTMFPVLKEFAGRRAGLLSGGRRQQLSIARALITRPKLMILDEPTEGIQPNIVAEVQQAIRTMAEDKGIGVVLVEQRCNSPSNGRIATMCWPPGASSPPAKAVLHRLRPPKRPCAYNRALKTRRYKAFFERQSLYLRVLRAPIAEPSSKKPHDPSPGRCNGRFLSCRLRL